MINIIINAIYLFGILKKWFIFYRLEDEDYVKLVSEQLKIAKEKAINEKDPSILSDIINNRIK